MISENNKLSDVVSNNIDLLPILHRLGLSANIGERSISEVCGINQKDMRFVLGILNTYSSADYFPKPDDLELQPLVDFLIQTHNYHKQVTIPRINGFIEQLKQHMPNEKLLIIVEKYLNQYIRKLIQHIDFEELEIFPLVKMDNKYDVNSLKIKKIFKQHTNVENEISDLKTIIIRHIPDNIDMNLVHDLLHALSHFEKEQLDHARFEDKILIPKLLKLLSK
ncbi:MAG: hemerythrin domain-containing protein [Bacteroidales bacterium]|nr:hemerythrin domain-containing protein [Bacteroidales bacterium]